MASICESRFLLYILKKVSYWKVTLSQCLVISALITAVRINFDVKVLQFSKSSLIMSFLLFVIISMIL